MEVVLKPEVKLQPRYIALGVLLLPVIFAPHVYLWVRIVSTLFLTALTGTYRVSTVVGDKFQSRLYFAYFPFKVEKCNLPGVVYVETKYNSVGWAAALMFFTGFIFDMLIPALGGAYEIWLITAKGREIVAWQGRDQTCFEENVALLQSRTGAELRGRTR